jgi:hypothetical protein
MSVPQLRRADRTGRWARHRRRDPSAHLDDRRCGRPGRGHGGGIEPGLVACLPDADPSCGVRRSATATVPASASMAAGSSASSSAGARRSSCPGVPRRVGGSGRRSVRWSFPQATLGTTACHQADDVPDLSSRDCTQGDGVDGRGSTSNHWTASLVVAQLAIALSMGLPGAAQGDSGSTGRLSVLERWNRLLGSTFLVIRRRS